MDNVTIYNEGFGAIHYQHRTAALKSDGSASGVESYVIDGKSSLTVSGEVWEQMKKTDFIINLIDTKQLLTGKQKEAVARILDSEGNALNMAESQVKIAALEKQLAAVRDQAEAEAQATAAAQASDGAGMAAQTAAAAQASDGAGMAVQTAAAAQAPPVDDVQPPDAKKDGVFKKIRNAATGG